MEPNDEVVERQKLVPNDIETEEEPNSQVTTAPQSAPKSSAPTPASPVTIPKVNIKSTSSGDTTRSRNSASCSIERTTSDKNTSSAKVTYVNERRQKSAQDESRFEFKSRPRKLLKVPDVKHMERALLGLLDDFHTGKLKAFGSGCTMDQMTKIREQQESLAKLHFELAAAEEDSLDSGTDLNAAKAQENMLQLVQRLEQLSISIEQLQTSHTGL
ncbi:coiled-coil domain-containing protein 28A isoform X3 [Episyrphus balteatus]|uniref:coiled-coil domain-containing protein 28A isoform X3 n=1 Tax=Episyrphus balteatus TaxID=286459 RepID=UPI002486BF45|nr:coiled-coil domain-containing protein 28A isoform X3 [Episyrphus balteatus]